VLEGHADFVAAPELRLRVDEAVNRGARKLVLDFTRSTSVDSTAGGILVGALKRLRPRGGCVAVVCPDPDIREVFHFAGLESMFPITETLVDALAALDESGPGRQ
jgi:anti-sigma B factor antagonist